MLNVPFRHARPTPCAIGRAAARAIDVRAEHELGLAGLVLMENAGRGAAEWAMEVLGELGAPAGPVAIVCGRGMNGGDGLVVARQLACRGVVVHVHLAFAPDAARATTDAGRNLHVVRAMGVDVTPVASGDALAAELARRGPALVVDALFGTGLDRPLDAHHRSLVLAINECGVPVLALDLPSGLDAETGDVHGACVVARWTATFVAPKLGLVRAFGPRHAGQVEVIELGLPPSWLLRESAP